MSSHVAVVGSGPAGLMAAEVAAASGARVTVYDRMPSVGRKLLMAGRGGLNLTHGEDIARLMTRYGAAAPHLEAAIAALSPAALRAWCEGLGEPTFVGSSGRIFPQSFKASPLLRAWLRRLDGLGVGVRPRHRWTGFHPRGRLAFETPSGETTVEADATVLALGGASWPRLGSKGDWVAALSAMGIETAPLKPANCGFRVEWSEIFRQRFEGAPLKQITLSFGGHVTRGEAIVTRGGLEGGGIYALSAALREAIAAHGAADLVVDLVPDLDADALAQRLAGPRAKQSLTTFLRKTAHLQPVAIGLLREAARASPTPMAAMPPIALAQLIKAVPVRLTGVAPLAGAISSAGGIAFKAIDESYMLRGRPGVFVAGEMLDWEAPTGGYLLQACFATGAAAGRGALNWLAARAS